MMRSQSNIDIITSMLHTTTTAEATRTGTLRRIPRHEQDEDLWRDVVPGRDPVTQVRGFG